MADSGTVVRIRVNGAPMGVRDNKVWAFLLDEGQETAWVITSVGDSVQLAERASGKVLAMPSTEPFAQAELAAKDAANSRWTLRRLDDEGYTSVQTITESGYYSLVLAGAKQSLGRNPVEDRSLLPKKVVLLPDEVEPSQLIIEVT